MEPIERPDIKKIEASGCPEEPTLIGRCHGCQEPLHGEDSTYCCDDCFEWQEELYCEDCFNEILEMLKEKCKRTA